MKHAFNYYFCLFSSRCFEFLKGWNYLLMSVSPMPCIKKVVLYQAQQVKALSSQWFRARLPELTSLNPHKGGRRELVLQISSLTFTHVHTCMPTNILSLKNFKTYKVVFKTNRGVKCPLNE